MPNSQRDEKRLGVDLPRDLIHELHNHVPWGRKKYVYEEITRQLVAMLDDSSKPQMVVAMIIDGEITTQDILTYNRDPHEEKKGQ